MIGAIKYCNKCNLCNNQKPLLDNKVESDVMWVGLSAKAVENTSNEVPLSADTNTGSVICKLEKSFDSVEYYKTNLVKCLPLDNNGKLRYPTMNEMEVCFSNLIYEIEILKPTVVFLLGNNVCKIVEKHYKLKFEKFTDYEYNHYKCNDICFVPIQHPSYITIYKRKYTDQYIDGVRNVLESLFH